MSDAEFGVPVPGRVLPREQWAKTGWRDNGQPFDWVSVFGRTAPRIVDLGCGNGRYLIGSALQRPNADHLGVDLVQVAIDHAAHRANQRGLKNTRFVTGDANPWLYERLLPDSVDEIHVYHPQPYYEVADRSKRLLTPEYLERIWRALRSDGLLVLQTDNKSYWSWLLQAVKKHFDPVVRTGPWPDAPRGRTRREIIARKKGLAVWRLEARRRDQPQAGEIAPPDFDANRPRFKKR
jgi:tRNA (guanine-N7-)-methyltransferase